MHDNANRTDADVVQALIASTFEAKAVCEGCAVRAECLEFALETDQKFGIWGGTSEQERRRMRRAS